MVAAVTANGATWWHGTSAGLVHWPQGKLHWAAQDGKLAEQLWASFGDSCSSGRRAALTWNQRQPR